MYEILPKCKGRNFQLCIYNGKGVGLDSSQRRIFERIFQKSKIDYYICPECKYLCIGPNQDIIVDSLQIMKEDKKGFYIELPTKERIYLNSQNFFLVCSKKECQNPEAWVKKYIPKQKNKGSF